jgi:hypothetical protein
MIAQLESEKERVENHYLSYVRMFYAGDCPTGE